VLNEKLNLTAAIFRTEKTNTRATTDEGTTKNIGETRVDGIELGVNGNITEKWAVSAGYTYLDSEPLVVIMANKFKTLRRTLQHYGQLTKLCHS